MEINYATVLVCLAAIVTAFVTTFLRGFQNKNVAGGHQKLAFFFGYAMNICDVLTIGIVVANGMFIAMFAGFGAGLGWVISMRVHDKIMKKRLKEIEAEKKIKKRSKQEDRIRDVVIQVLKERGVDDPQRLIDEIESDINKEEIEIEDNIRFNLNKEPA